MRISDWSSDVCSSDLLDDPTVHQARHRVEVEQRPAAAVGDRQVEGLGKVRRLPGLSIAAAEADIGLQDIHGLIVDELAEAPAMPFHLPRRKRDTGMHPEIRDRKSTR